MRVTGELLEKVQNDLRGSRFCFAAYHSWFCFSVLGHHGGHVPTKTLCVTGLCCEILQTRTRYCVLQQNADVIRTFLFCLALLFPSGTSIIEESDPSMDIIDTAVDAVILLVDDDGNVVDEMIGTMMQF